MRVHRLWWYRARIRALLVRGLDWIVEHQPTPERVKKARIWSYRDPLARKIRGLPKPRPMTESEMKRVQFDLLRH